MNKKREIQIVTVLILLSFIASCLTVHFWQPQEPENPPERKWIDYVYELRPPESIQWMNDNDMMWFVNENSNITVEIPIKIFRMGNDERPFATYIEIYDVGSYTSISTGNTTYALDTNETGKYCGWFETDDGTHNMETAIGTDWSGIYNVTMTMKLNEELVSVMCEYEYVEVSILIETDTATRTSFCFPEFNEYYHIRITKVSA